MQTDETKPGERPVRQGEGVGPAARVVDPSDAVTGMSILFGAIGAVVGIVASLFASPLGWATIAYGLVAAFAGGSAGVVTGGMVGAIFAVVRGVAARPPPTQRS
jgi:hypothetical protein